MSTDQLPPHDLAAEQAVLGSLLIDRDAIAQIADWLKPEAFWDSRCRTMYRAMLALWAERVPCDAITLCAKLDAKGVLDRIGGLAMISEVQASTPTAMHLHYYAGIVRSMAHRRSLIDAGAALVAKAYEGDVDLDTAVGDVRRAAEPFIEPELLAPTLLSESMPLHKQFLQDLWDGVIEEHLTPTGFASLDDALYGGLRPQDLMILAAMSGMGKTALMLRMALHNAERTGRLSTIVSLEMGEEAIKNRLAVSLAGVPFSTTKARDRVKVYDLAKRERDEKALLAAMDYLETLPIAILTKQRTTDRVLAEMDRLSAQHELGMVAIDHLDHLEDAGRWQNDEQRFAELAKRCKGIGQRANIPNVTLAQLHRGVEAKEPYLPEPKHIRGSGRIRELSDVLVMPYRRRAYVELKMLDGDNGLDYLEYPRTNEQRVELFLFKSRNGENGLSVSLGFDPLSMGFADASGLRRAA